MENSIEDIKKRIDIVEFIGSFITLKKAGRNFKALCPFHREKTPSFIVSPERQIWHCFGSCAQGGDVIKFLMKWENITFFEALKELAQKTGVTLRRLSFEDKIWRKKEKLLTMNQLAAEFFAYLLHKTKYGEQALSYLEMRGINESVIKKFGLGYAPDSWDSLLKFLKRKKYEEEEIFENGLVIKREGGGFYDRFRGRLMFPIRDARGNILGFSGRILKNEKEAKYINTPETPIYHKRETLFGIDLAKEAIKREKNVVIVEGEFDVISPYQHGFSNFIAIKGSALTREQLMLLKRYTERITLALDTDIAGEEAIKRGIEEAERLEFEIEIIVFYYAKDPDEAVRIDKAKFRKIIKKPIPIYDFLIDVAKKKYSSDNPFDKKRIGEEVVPVIARINNPIVQSHYIKKVANILNIGEESIERLIARIKKEKKPTLTFSSFRKKQIDLDRQLLLEKYVLSLIFQDKNSSQIADIVFSMIAPSDFSLPSYQKICQLFLDTQKKLGPEFNLTKFIDKLSPELQPVFDEIYLFASTEHEFGSVDINRLTYEIKRFALKRKIKEILLLSDDIKEEKQNTLSTLTTQLKEVEKKILKL